MSDLAFKVNNLNLYYGEKQALFNVNMEIEERAITALIGPSGCGKSTFLRVLNRMNDLIEGCRITGEVLYRGQDVFDVDDVNQLRRQIGMVFQKPNPFPMSIYDNITFALKSMGIKKKSILDETVERSLKQASIWDEVSDRLHESALALSG
ncbi:MAG: ATP-binding cassette domain-containing protein, partial [Escherichia coli]|nr:ATP-binding cassette domain-containing protein [Escherichia coli]